MSTEMEITFREELEERVIQVGQILERYLPEQAGGKRPASATIADAMRYSVQAGGKRLRPVMLLEAYKLFAASDSRQTEASAAARQTQAEAFAAALEMIHTYSLIHDDLPAMDNDDYRRGRKTTHKVYGEAMGILAGDGLLGYASEVAAGTLLFPEADYRRGAAALLLLAARPGISGMLGGQVMDIEMEEGKQEATFDSLCEMYEKKTGALISCALEIGCVLGGGSEEDRKELAEIGRLTGLAFQVRDDILDVTGEESRLGKTLHSDERNHKTTCVTLLGLQRAGELVESWSMEAVRRMKQIEAAHPDYNGFLSRLIVWLIRRDY